MIKMKSCSDTRAAFSMQRIIFLILEKILARESALQRQSEKKGNSMRKIIRWYLALLIFAAVCVLGVWVVSSRNNEPKNATLVWNSSEPWKWKDEQASMTVAAGKQGYGFGDLRL
ncbi:MAG: hypothetical protein LUI14_15070 [Lachnospiraceae bacterium]|nr:hypothetical protein [Lachnospiraceae bacterium]